MIVSAAQDLIKGRLGNFTSSALDTMILNEMNHAQQFILEGGDFHPWFLLTETSDALATADDERLPVPDDFIIEWEEGCLSWKETTASVYTCIEKDDYDFLQGRYGLAGNPKGYSLAGDNFLIVPQPTQILNWRMRYFAKQPLSVNSGDENVWLKNAGDWLVAEAGLVMANNYVRDKVAAAGFLAMRTEARARLRDLDVAKAEANRERMMGE